MKVTVFTNRQKNEVKYVKYFSNSIFATDFFLNIHKKGGFASMNEAPSLTSQQRSQDYNYNKLQRKFNSKKLY